MVQVVVIVVIIGILWAILSFIGNLLEALFDWIEHHKNLILRVLGIIALIILGVVLVSLPPKAWLVLLFVLACIGLYCFMMKKQAQKYLSWMANVGIDEKSTSAGKAQIQSWIQKKGYTTEFHGHILLNEFYNRILLYVNQQGIVSQKTFEDCCFQAAPAFQTNYTEIVLNYLANKDDLLPLKCPEPLYYLSNQLRDEYISLFDRQGAVTKDSFIEICKTANEGLGFTMVSTALIVTTILDYLISTKAAKKIPLKETGEALFVTEKEGDFIGLVRREINLDN